MMQLTYSIYEYRWLQTMPAAEAPIDAKSSAEALPPDDSDAEPHYTLDAG
jgi:hypothetical protein